MQCGIAVWKRHRMATPPALPEEHQPSYVLIGNAPTRTRIYCAGLREIIDSRDQGVAVMPPSTGITAPVIAEACGEQSQAMTAATSCGSMRRPSGC